MICRIPGSPFDSRPGVCYTGIEEGVAIAGVVASVASAAAAIYQGQQASSAANYNAELAAQNATAATQQSQQDAMLAQAQSTQQLGAVAAAYGGSGVTNEGSALDVLSSSASNAELTRQTILYQGQVKAAGYQDEEALDAAQASNDATGGYFTAMGVLAKGAASTYQNLNLGGGPSPAQQVANGTEPL